MSTSRCTETAHLFHCTSKYSPHVFVSFAWGDTLAVTKYCPAPTRSLETRTSTTLRPLETRISIDCSFPSSPKKAQELAEKAVRASSVTNWNPTPMLDSSTLLFKV